jgi:hypothetical protein
MRADRYVVHFMANIPDPGRRQHAAEAAALPGANGAPGPA